MCVQTEWSVTSLRDGSSFAPNLAVPFVSAYRRRVCSCFFFIMSTLKNIAPHTDTETTPGKYGQRVQHKVTFTVSTPRFRLDGDKRDASFPDGVVNIRILQSNLPSLSLLSLHLFLVSVN